MQDLRKRPAFPAAHAVHQVGAVQQRPARRQIAAVQRDPRDAKGPAVSDEIQHRPVAEPELRPRRVRRVDEPDVADAGPVDEVEELDARVGEGAQWDVGR